ncbi:MAG: dodecin family protein [Bacteroidota bacterium]|nr:dodecin family protein [Bacteroidota bacterium]
MAIVKVIEVIASSEKSFDDAVKQAVKETSRTIRNIDSVWVKDMKVHVKDGKIKSYGVICKVSFRIESEEKKEKKDKKEKDKKE